MEVLWFVNEKWIYEVFALYLFIFFLIKILNVQQCSIYYMLYNSVGNLCDINTAHL